MPMTRTTGHAALFLSLSLACAQAQTPATPATPAFDGARAHEHVRRLVAIGPRVAGTPGAEQARDYIAEQMKTLGLSVEEQSFDAATPAGSVETVNLRVMIQAPSTSSRRDRLIIAGHYDTKRFKEFTFVGANDAGSSTAFLIEIARVLKNRTNALPIELLFLDGEEAVVEWQGNGPHIRQPLLRRRGAQGGYAVADPRARARRHDWRPRSAHLAGVELDAVVDGRHLGDGQAPEAPGVHRRTRRQSRTTTCRSSRRAYRPSTSSISTTRRGTPPATRWTKSRANRFRSWETCCWPRCRRSRRNWSSGRPAVEGLVFGRCLAAPG